MIEQQLVFKLKEMFTQVDPGEDIISGSLKITNIEALSLPIDELDMCTVKIYTLAFLSSHPEQLFKTDEIINTKNPNFEVNIQFPLQMSLNELMETQLILQFYDSGNQKQLIKEVQIDLQEIVEEQKEEVEVGQGEELVRVQCQWLTQDEQKEEEQQQEEEV